MVHGKHVVSVIDLQGVAIIILVEAVVVPWAVAGEEHSHGTNLVESGYLRVVSQRPIRFVDIYQLITVDATVIPNFPILHTSVGPHWIVRTDTDKVISLWVVRVGKESMTSPPICRFELFLVVFEERLVIGAILVNIPLTAGLGDKVRVIDVKVVR